MTKESTNNIWPKVAGLVLACVVTAGSLVIFVGLNIEKVDRIVGAIIAWDGNSGTYLACYEDFLLYATSDEFYRFASGSGLNSIADFRIQFTDGNVIALPKLTPADIEKHFPESEKVILSDRGLTIVSYGIGFDRFDFVGSELEGITVSKGRQIAIDFGDGQFVKLPVARKRLLELLGPPKEWQKRKGGPP